MALDKREAVRQLWSVIHAYDNEDRLGKMPGREFSAAAQRRLMTRALATLDRLAPAGSAYLAQAQEVMSDEDSVVLFKVEQLVGIVQALREDYDDNAMQSVLELAHADLFDDFLEMARELHRKGFIGPAAVVAGSVLEEHLRKLAVKHTLTLFDAKGRPKSVEVLGVELREKGAFNELERKGVTAWYAQRTDGAHGHVDRLVDSEVERMIDAVRDFVARHPA